MNPDDVAWGMIWHGTLAEDSKPYGVRVRYSSHVVTYSSLQSYRARCTVGCCFLHA